MAKVKVEFDTMEATSVSIAIREYRQILEAKKTEENPNDTIVKAIRIRVICELKTAYTKLGKAIRESGEKNNKISKRTELAKK